MKIKLILDNKADSKEIMDMLKNSQNIERIDIKFVDLNWTDSEINEFLKFIETNNINFFCELSQAMRLYHALTIIDNCRYK